MPETLSVTVYTLEELKESHPEAYKAVHERWEALTLRDNPPWMEETMASLRAVIDACGGKLADWSIGAWTQCSATVEGIDDEEQGREWFLHNVLKPNGYTRRNGHAYFPGNCKFTGYCADDDFLEATWKALKRGDTLTRALEGLADKAGEMMEADYEQAQEEESMLANWGADSGTRFTETGKMA